jgi:hypothetical protein
MKRESSNSHESPDVRPTRSSTRRSTTGSVDEQALSLREADMSYTAIARRLELKRAANAHKAFIRAVLSRQGDQQRSLVANERARLDKLELLVRKRDAAEPDQLQRRLQAVAKLRAALP